MLPAQVHCSYEGSTYPLSDDYVPADDDDNDNYWGTPVCDDGRDADCCDVDGTCYDGDDDWCCDGAFYCSNDGEAYAEAMGGVLCPYNDNNYGSYDYEQYMDYGDDGFMDTCSGAYDAAYACYSTTYVNGGDTGLEYGVTEETNDDSPGDCHQLENYGPFVESCLGPVQGDLCKAERYAQAECFWQAKATTIGLYCTLDCSVHEADPTPSPTLRPTEAPVIAGAVTFGGISLRDAAAAASILADGVARVAGVEASAVEASKLRGHP